MEMLIHLPVTSRPLIFPQKEAFLSPCNFATSHLTACILNFYLPLTSRPTKWRTLSQRPTGVTKNHIFWLFFTCFGPILKEAVFPYPVWGTAFPNSRISKFSRKSLQHGLLSNDPFSKVPLFPAPMSARDFQSRGSRAYFTANLDPHHHSPRIC